MRTDTVKGAVFSDYELPDQEKKNRKRSELKSAFPVVLLS
jgi:hypothetical protein